MMKIYRKFCLFIIPCFIFILSACGINKSTAEMIDNEEGRKTLRIVTHAAYAPFEYLQGDGIKGFDIDFIKAAADEAGYAVKIEHVDWETLFHEIEYGNADIAVSALSITKERSERYDFSLPYFLSTHKILVRNDSEITKGKDLIGKVVAVQQGTTGQEKAEAILGKNSFNIRTFENNHMAIQEMLNGRADAVIADHVVLEEYVKNNPERNIKLVTDKSFEKEFYGLMFTKGSELRTVMDQAIERLFSNGTYVDIHKEWFGTEPDIERLKNNNG